MQLMRNLVKGLSSPIQRKHLTQYAKERYVGKEMTALPFRPLTSSYKALLTSIGSLVAGFVGGVFCIGCLVAWFTRPVGIQQAYHIVTAFKFG